MRFGVFPIGGEQRGAALILSLLLLLVLTLLAISSMQGSIVQEKMVSGAREGMISLEIAESGLRDAEQVLESISLLSSFDGTEGLYGPDDATPDPLDYNWAQATGVRDANEVQGVTPRYFIEHIGNAYQEDQITDVVVEGYTHETGALNAQAFRIVVWSPGVSGDSQRIVESYYTRNL